MKKLGLRDLPPRGTNLLCINRNRAFELGGCCLDNLTQPQLQGAARWVENKARCFSPLFRPPRDDLLLLSNR
jgi:hypothetical protein